MQLNYKINKLLVSLLVSTALCSVGRVNAAGTTLPVQSKVPVEASELEIKDNDVMAVIQGKAVTAHDLDVMAMNLDSNLMRLPVNKRRLATLRIYISMVALAHAAEQKGLAAGERYQQMMAFARNEVLQKLYINQEIIGKISDADLKVRYDKEVAATPKEEEVHARHVIVKTKPEAEAIIKRLEQGENFETIAKANSTDGSAAVGGDLGYFSHGQMVEPFEKAAFALKVGEYTHIPVQSPFGWHVIKLEDKRIKKLPAFEDMRENMRNLVASDRYKASIGDLRKQEDIKIPNNAIANELAKFDNLAAVNGAEDADEEAN